MSRARRRRGNAAVTLTATVSKNGVSSVRTFTLMVIARAEDNDLAYATEDAESAVIVYCRRRQPKQRDHESGPRRQPASCTRSALTWESDSETIVILRIRRERQLYGDGDKARVLQTAKKRVTLTVTGRIRRRDLSKDHHRHGQKAGGSEEQSAQADADAAYITYQSGDDADSVTGNITLVFEVRAAEALAFGAAATMT
jgi:hypothetical protein